MKHIVIDARIINSSTGHYIEYLLHNLQEIDSVNRYTVLIPEKDKDYWAPRNSNFKVVYANQAQYSFAEQTSFALLLYRLKADLVHFCMPQQPLLYFGRRVTTVHDTTLVRFDNIDMNPIVYWIKKLIFILLLRNVIFRSKAILTPTEFVKNDLLDFSSRRHEHKIKATLLAGEVVNAEPAPVKEFIGKDFIFFVGNAFPYKNLRRIIDGHQAVLGKFPELQLVFAGKLDVFYEELQQYVSTNSFKNIHFLGYISDNEKLWLFKNAKSYVVASLSEGFHMPLFEAMENDCPVISSNASCLPEVAADAALYFNPGSTEDLTEKLTLLLSDKKVRSDLIKKGRARTSKFSWRRTTEETLSVYNSVLGN